MLWNVSTKHNEHNIVDAVIDNLLHLAVLRRLSKLATLYVSPKPEESST